MYHSFFRGVPLKQIQAMQSDPLLLAERVAWVQATEKQRQMICLFIAVGAH